MESPVSSGLALEAVSISTLREGTNAEGGHRYVSATFRVRNMTGGPLANLTVIPVINKIDLTDSTESAADINGIPTIRISAKHNLGVDLLLDFLYRFSAQRLESALGGEIIGDGSALFSQKPL